MTSHYQNLRICDSVHPVSNALNLFLPLVVNNHKSQCFRRMILLVLIFSCWYTFRCEEFVSSQKYCSELFSLHTESIHYIALALDNSYFTWKWFNIRQTQFKKFLKTFGFIRKIYISSVKFHIFRFWLQILLWNICFYRTFIQKNLFKQSKLHTSFAFNANLFA